jgi:SAM-dependent methyltransferase
MTPPIQRNGHFCQFGCGLSAPDGWMNFDSSPRLRLQRLPVIGALMPGGPFGRFPKSVMYGDIVRGLPLPAGSVELLYSSHVLEHLSLSDGRAALRQCLTLLRPGGVFRSVMPDFERLARQYCDATDAAAAERFLDHSGLGTRTRPRGLVAKLNGSIGNSLHLWLWDYKAIEKELADTGFIDIRRAHYADSDHSEFAAVESEERWRGGLGFECRRPPAPSR